MFDDKEKSSRDSFITGDIAIVILIVLSILLGVFIYSEAGSVGRFLGPLLGGLIGFIKYLLIKLLENFI